MKQRLLSLFIALFGMAAGAQADVEVNEKNFPDTYFREYISKFDSDKDGYLSNAEIARVRSINVPREDIFNLTGIRFFTALEELDCNSNQLTALNVSANTKLQRLNCFGNQLKTLDVSKNTALEYLYCEYNKLTALNVSKNTALQTLSCYSNRLTDLDVSENTALQYLYCSGNQLTSLDVSKNTALKELKCVNNKLTALNVSKNTSLYYLNCNDNKLNTLDVSKNTALTRLECRNNQLTALDVSKNTALRYLYCFNNSIRGEGMQTLVKGLLDRSSKEVGELRVYDNTIADGNMMTVEQVAAVRAKNWRVKMWNGNNWENYPGVVPIDATNFPDENFRNWILAQDYGADGILTNAEIAGVTIINVNNKNISDLKGIEFFTALKELECFNNQLTALDVSKNTALKILSCTKNKLTALDVSKNTALQTLRCRNNQLTALDVSKNTALQSLDCSGNQLTTLDVSKNTALKELECFNNQLTALDVSKNTALKSLDCYNNSIRGEGMQTLVNSLLDRSATSQGYLYVYRKETATGNEMTEEQVATATAKNWRVKMWNGNGEKWIDYPGVENCLPINATNFPDENFRNWILMQYNGKDGILTDLEIASVTYMDVSEKSISNLKGIEFFTALKELYCYSNQLTTLDVSKNTALQELYCYSNQLTTLDVSKNTALKSLDCSGNGIRGKAMQTLVNGLLDRSATSQGYLYVYKNETATGNEMTDEQLAAATAKNWRVMMWYDSEWVDYPGGLPINATNFPDAVFRDILYSWGTNGFIPNVAGWTYLDVSEKNISNLKGIELFTALTYLDCSGNQLITLDVSKNTALLHLECGNNQLTALDVSKNTALEYLGCWGNQLTTLDVSKNKELDVLCCYGNGIRGAGMATLVNSLYDRSATSNGYLYVYFDNTKADGNMMTTSQVSSAKAKNWRVLMGNGDYPGGVPINATNFPDRQFRAYISDNFDSDTDGFLSDPEIVNVLGIYVSNKYISDLKGIEFFTALQSLSCSGNKLTSLDVSKNTALEYLSCENNQLAALDVSKNTTLEYLHCENNQLTTLDLSKNTALEYLYCYGNQLTALDVSKNTALTRLECRNNQLTALDVSKNSALEVLYCYSNQLTTLDVSKNPALEVLHCENNQLTTLDVSKNPALKDLYCRNNQLTTLILNNPALPMLDCSNNKLTTLDVSKNTALQYLYCCSNSIRGEGMQTLVNSLCDRSGTSQGTLSVYNDKIADGNEMTTSQVADAKAKNWRVRTYGGYDYPGVSITLNKSEAILEKGKTMTLKATVSSEIEDKSVTWKSSNTAVATVSSAGKVKGVKAGVVTITCTSEATGKSSTCQITVGYVKLDQTEAILEKTKTMTLKATVYPSALEDKSVTWESSDTKIATVTSAGEVTGVKAGTATITCTSVATGLSTTCTVTVSGVVLNQSEVILRKKNTLTLTPIFYPETLEDKSVTWKSSDKEVATVSKEGVVKGVKSGVVTITCTSNATGDKATCEVTVATISLNKSSVTLNQGKTVTLTPTVYPTTLEDKSVTWDSSDKTIVTVTRAGQVKGVKGGTATITCTSVATGVSTTCTVTVNAVTLDQSEVIVRKKNTVTLTPTLYPTSLEDKSVKWKSSDKTIATVSSAGKVTGVKSGVVTITCTSVATGAKATCKVTVATIAINKSSVIVRKKKSVTLTPTVYPTTLEDKSVTWKSSDESIATVSNDGVVTGVKSGFVTITCMSNATGVSTTCEVTVGTITLNKSSVTLTKDKSVTLTPTVYPTTLEDQSVTWKSSNKTVATVTSAGKVTGVKAGTATITCTSVATGLSTTCKVTVTESASARTIDGDDAEVTDIEIVEETPAVVEPFDVYDLRGHKVRQGVTSLDGLPAGIYIVNGKKVLKK